MYIILNYHKQFLPEVSPAGQRGVQCVLTVLTKGMSGRDCAAYRSTCEARFLETEEVAASTLQQAAAVGDKISKREAEELFDLGELSYRS